MSPLARQLLICSVAYVVGLLAALLAIIGLVDLKTISLTSGLPKVAATTPMLAVLVFWAVARRLGSPLSPPRTFLFGGLAIYSLLYLCGRLVVAGLSGQSATLFGLVALFFLAFYAISSSRAHGR